MTNWKIMKLPLKEALLIREKLQTITDDYNTEDGQIRWLQDNNLDINLGSFFSIVPQDIRNIMTNWKYMNLALKDAILIRERLQTITDDYNTEDGQIRWLQDNNLDINLGSFFSIIPQEIRNIMTNWKIMNLPLKKAKEKYRV
jgi:predicted PP-loop superfamily ATPase